LSIARAERIVIVPDDADDAFGLARRVLGAIGTVTMVDIPGRFVLGSTRAGLATVHVGIAVMPGVTGTSLMVEASGRRTMAHRVLDQVLTAIGADEPSDQA
jgi:hypothetical protein